MTVPLLASFARRITATAPGWIVVEKTSFGLDGLFAAIALGITLWFLYRSFSFGEPVARYRKN
jgi:hypothetical protein